MNSRVPRRAVRIIRSFSTVALLATACAEPKPAPLTPPEFIAHAGGIANHRTYTNSLEALDHSVARGFEAIEIDLSWTLDDHLVLLHDWVREVPLLFNHPPGKMSFDEFRTLRSSAGLTLLTLDDLGPWLADNPSVVIFTDVKDRNVEGLGMLAQVYPRQLHRIVPQIYHPSELAAVQDLGYRNIVFTLYETDLKDDAVVEFASTNKLFGITMAIRRALTTDLPARLAAADIPVFVHPVNDHPTSLKLRERGVAGIYTDWLSPMDALEAARPGPWIVARSGVKPGAHRVAPFIASKMDGLMTSVVFSNDGALPAPVHVTAMAADGVALGSAAIQLQPGEERRLNAAEIFPPSVDRGWLDIEASSDVEATSRWVFRNNPETERPLESTTCSGFVTRGSGIGVSGLLIALVNPTDSTHAYVLRRRIGDNLVDEDTLELPPGHQLVRVYRSSTDEEIALQVTGGPMVPLALRWDPLVRYIE